MMRTVESDDSEAERSTGDNRHVASSSHANAPPPEVSGARSKGGTLVFYEGGQYVKLAEHAPPSGRPQRGGGRRGKVSGTFCARHRRRMEKKMGKLRRKVPALFATLTYPNDFDRYPDHGFPTRSETYKRHLRNFWRRLKRRFPSAAMIWRLEFHASRGAPHFHVLLYLPFAAVTSKWVVSKWLEVIGTDPGDDTTYEANHAEWLTAENDIRRAMGYLAKISDEQLTSQHVLHSGRWWGVRGEKNLPYAQRRVLTLTRDEMCRVRRLILRKMDKTSNVPIRALWYTFNICMRRGIAEEIGRYADRLIGQRKYVNPQTGEITTWDNLTTKQRAQTVQLQKSGPNYKRSKPIRRGRNQLLRAGYRGGWRSGNPFRLSSDPVQA